MGNSISERSAVEEESEERKAAIPEMEGMGVSRIRLLLGDSNKLQPRGETFSLLCIHITGLEAHGSSQISIRDGHWNMWSL